MSGRLVALLALGLSCLSCGKRLERNECQRLLDHYVELLLREDRPGANAGELLRFQQEARKKAERDPAFGECQSRVSRRSFECAMDAQDANKLEQCLL
jgi:hypothetical protein